MIQDNKTQFMDGSYAQARLERFCEFISAIPSAASIDLAFYSSSAQDFRYADSNLFRRFYFGSEFCEKFLPSMQAFDTLAKSARDAGVTVTAVTPLSSESSFDQLKSTLTHILEDRLVDEVVVNDWGVYNFIKRTFPDVGVIPGRILVRQKKDPRIIHLESSEIMEYFPRTMLDNMGFISFLRKEGVKRVEVDNPCHGVKLGDESVPPEVSLYFPYVFLSTSRQCAPARCENCRNAKYVLKNSLIQREIVYTGRSQFYINWSFPENLKNISRIVYQYKIPV